MNLDRARTVADAVLYEGYLLYPYRATSSKNQSRWQWGVVGPLGAAAAGVGEESSLSTQCLVRRATGDSDSGVTATAQVRIRLRFLQLQTREVERAEAGDEARFEPVAELRTPTRTWMSWDEAVAHEIELGPCLLDGHADERVFDVVVEGGEAVEALCDDGRTVGRLVRRRQPLHAAVRVHAAATGVDGLVRLGVAVENVADGRTADEGQPVDKQSAVRHSLIGTHLLIVAEGATFVSLLDPPDDASEAAATCQQRRCWPVLAGEPGEDDIVLASPIILYDYPEVAEQSAGALFDSTEIDEILTLRVMTLTDEEKAAARATDPRAAEIIDRCDQMTPDSLQALHGILRDPRAGVAGLPGLPDMDDVPTFTDLPSLTDMPTFTDVPPSGSDIRNVDPPSFDAGGTPWWDPAADASVRPDVDTVMVSGVCVGKDSLVRLRPSRRADAQDIFFTGQTARVTAVLSDVDGQVHVAVVMVDDPAADMHEWYGRYLYFAPEELEPLGQTSTAAAPARTASIQTTSDHREESRP